jgi:IMP dehydrogenase
MTDTRTSDRVLELTSSDVTDSTDSITVLTVLPEAATEESPTIDLRSSPNAVETVFDRFEALGFSDVVVVPRDTNVKPNDVDLHTALSAGISLDTPIVVSSTVCNAATAIVIARLGGIAVLPGNIGLAQQVAAVQRVKQAHRGWIETPISLSHADTIADAGSIWLKHGISGAPVVDALGRVIGMLTKRDIRFCTAADSKRSVREFMTQLPHLVTAPVGTTLAEARQLMLTNRVEKLPMLNEHDQLVGLLTVRDLLAAEAHKSAATDGLGRLRCAAFVGAGPDLHQRVEALIEAGADAVVIANSDGSFAGIANAVESVRTAWPQVTIVAGKVNTSEGVRTLHGVGVDAVITGGSSVAGVGIPILSRLNDTARAAHELGTALIALGVESPGDVAKAMAVGASAVMIDPSVLGADANASATYADRMASQIASGLRTGMAAAGASNIADLHATARFMKVNQQIG